MIFLETERLRLRRFTPRDVDLLVELDGDPAVMRYLTGGRPTPRAVIAEELLPAILSGYRRRDRLGRWAAETRDNGEFIGWFALDPGAAGEAELGYRLRRAAWGHGYATEASRALIHTGFTDLGLRRIYAETMAVNQPSRRVMRRAGLRYVRTFHLAWDDPIEGVAHGEVEYALELADWRDSGG